MASPLAHRSNKRTWGRATVLYDPPQGSGHVCKHSGYDIAPAVADRLGFGRGGDWPSTFTELAGWRARAFPAFYSYSGTCRCLAGPAGDRRGAGWRSNVWRL